MLRRGKKGDTVRWNSKKQSGWIYDGTWWRHYRNGKPTGKKEKHRRNAEAVFKGLGVEQVARFLTGTPSQDEFEKARKRNAKRKEKLKLKKQKEKEDINTLLENTKNVEPKSSREKMLENMNKSREVINKFKNRNNRSNEEQVLLENAKNKNNNNNKGALHNENKKRKSTLDLKATDPKTGKEFKTNVHTKHYKTGERLGVLTRNQRRAYEAEANNRTFEGQVAAFEKETKHGKPHKRKTLYRSALRKKGEYPRR